MKTTIICVSGRIHEVGYRTRVMSLAHVLNVKGYVRNLPDTSVEIVAQASEEILEKFIKKIKIQDEMVHVDAVKVDYSETFEGFKDFHKIVGPNETDSRLDKAVIELEGIKEELKLVVAALKETNKSIQNMHKDLKEGNQEIIKEIHTGNQEINENIKNMHHDLKDNHAELITEVRGLREDNNERVISEIQEVKTLLKAHLKIP